MKTFARTFLAEINIRSSVEQVEGEGGKVSNYVTENFERKANPLQPVECNNKSRPLLNRVKDEGLAHHRAEAADCSGSYALAFFTAGLWLLLC